MEGRRGLSNKTFLAVSVCLSRSLEIYIFLFHREVAWRDRRETGAVACWRERSATSVGERPRHSAKSCLVRSARPCLLVHDPTKSFDTATRRPASGVQPAIHDSCDSHSCPSPLPGFPARPAGWSVGIWPRGKTPPQRATKSPPSSRLICTRGRREPGHAPVQIKRLEQGDVPPLWGLVPPAPPPRSRSPTPHVEPQLPNQFRTSRDD